MNGWSHDKKKGSTRYDRIPTDLIEEVEIRQPEDYLQFVPYELEEPFHSKDFAKSRPHPSLTGSDRIEYSVGNGNGGTNRKTGKQLFISCHGYIDI